ncbi:trigger factor [Halothiobacillus diazotrophicus]|uniref:Trigger factor n=1 Tax=Halothiobacillus diazotrophicus TaxID=1860122 RepID=A0A191ZJ73_9GAMM|nr:trigger factor [Halothiobacillus diazotrophicus]ANJ67951.1 trigger factor [Halothiobacillus diazotrophicus]
MQVELQSSEGLVRRLAIEVPANEIDVEVERRIKDMSRRVRMDGFRPGKAPMAVVRQRYLGQVRDEVVGEVMGRSYQAAIVEQKLRPAGNPSIESVAGEPGQNLSFVAAVEVYPEFEIGDLSALAVEVIEADVTDADVADMLETLREQNAGWQTVERAAKTGDRVTVNFTGRIDGEVFEGGSGTGMQVVLGEGRMLADFEKGLADIAAGEPERVFAVAFPDEYPVENLKGKTAEFTVEATEVEEKTLPALDDEFAKRFGSDSLDALKTDVRKNMERELKQAKKRMIKDAVLTAVADSLTFDIPKALVEEEAVAMRDGFVRQQMPDADPSKLDAGLFKDQAEKRVKMGLIIMEIVRAADLQVDEAQLEEFIADIASAYDEPEEVVAAYKGDREMMGNARTVVLEQQTVDYVLGKAKVTPKPMTFKAVMNPQG